MGKRARTAKTIYQRKFCESGEGLRLPREGLTSGEVRETSGEVRGTSGEVWGFLEAQGSLSPSQQLAKLVSKFSLPTKNPKVKTFRELQSPVNWTYSCGPDLSPNPSPQN